MDKVKTILTMSPHATDAHPNVVGLLVSSAMQLQKEVLRLIHLEENESLLWSLHVSRGGDKFWLQANIELCRLARVPHAVNKLSADIRETNIPVTVATCRDMYVMSHAYNREGRPEKNAKRMAQEIVSHLQEDQKAAEAS